jgi:6-phosphogluconolactonase
METRETLVVDDPATYVGERIAKAASAGAHIVLTGGSTPRAAYERAAELGADWSGATVWFTDERCVPPDHEQSNFAMASSAMLERIDGAPEVWRMQAELGPDEGARRYREDILRKFGSGIPRFDLILLGIGHDGHVASLFPGDGAVEEQETPVVGVEQPGMSPFVPRVTLTLPVLNAAYEVLFLVTGFEKAMAVRRAFGQAPSPAVPASLVQVREGALFTVVLDKDAAMGLRDTGGAAPQA